MLAIRTGTANDVPLLMTFFEALAAYERLSTIMTEEQVRQDGFGDRPKFRVLIAEIDGLPAGYALFLIATRLFEATAFSWKTSSFYLSFAGSVLGGCCWRMSPG